MVFLHWDMTEANAKHTCAETVTHDSVMSEATLYNSCSQHNYPKPIDIVYIRFCSLVLEMVCLCACVRACVSILWPYCVFYVKQVKLISFSQSLPLNYSLYYLRNSQLTSDVGLTHMHFSLFDICLYLF